VVRNEVDVQVGGKMLANGILEASSEPYIAIPETPDSEKAPKHLRAAEGLHERTAQKRRPRAPKSEVHLDSLLDKRHRALSLNALARSATLSGKRLIIEIRDIHPVKIIRHGNV
jgi:hypothetical protein